MPRIRSAAIAALFAAGAAGAQGPDRATFYLLVGSDTLTAERVERWPGELRFDLVDRRARTRVAFTGRTTPAALMESVTLRIFRAATDSQPVMTVDARFRGDSVGFVRGGVENWMRADPGALPGLNVSAALLEQSVMRARAVGGDSVSISVVQLPSGPFVPVTVLRRGADSVIVRVGSVAIHAAVSAQGRLLGAAIPSQNARYARGAATTGPLLATKSFAPPVGAPYSAQDVAIVTQGGLTLRGTLTVPQRAAGARVPAVVTITGSGPQDRDETPQGLSDYRLYYQLADTLGRRGVAVLRLDDRGAGSDAGPPTVTTAELADDIRAAVAWLRGRPEIDPARIALVGHSEGGTIAPMVAASDGAIAAIAILGGGVSPGRELLTFQQRFVADSMLRLTGSRRETALATYARAADSMAAAMPWMRFFMEYDGRATAARVRVPVLVVHGENDYQVPVAEAEKVAAAVRSGGNRDVTVRVFPGLNHLFVPHAGVGFSYEKLPTLVVAPEVIGAITDWISARLTR